MALMKSALCSILVGQRRESGNPDKSKKRLKVVLKIFGVDGRWANWMKRWEKSGNLSPLVLLTRKKSGPDLSSDLRGPGHGVGLQPRAAEELPGRGAPFHGKGKMASCP